MSDVEKPTDCTCEFPRVVARNMNGHDPSCPAYQRWAQEAGVECETGNAESDALREEIARLTRANRALDRELAAKDEELKVKDREFSGLMLEWDDLAAENRRVKQELEALRIAANS